MHTYTHPRSHRASPSSAMVSLCGSVCLLPPQSFTRLGKCYTFNSGASGYELLTTAKGGMGNGLELMLNIQQDEYLPVWGDTGECSRRDGLLLRRRLERGVRNGLLDPA